MDIQFILIDHQYFQELVPVPNVSPLRTIFKRLQTVNWTPKVVLQKMRADLGEALWAAGLYRLVSALVAKQKTVPAMDPLIKLKSVWLRPLNCSLGVRTMQSYQISLASSKVVKVMRVRGTFLTRACWYPLKQFFSVSIASSGKSSLICAQLVASLSCLIYSRESILSDNILTFLKGRAMATAKDSAAVAESAQVIHLSFSFHLSPNPALKNFLKKSQKANLAPPLRRLPIVLLRLNFLSAMILSKFSTALTDPKSCKNRKCVREQTLEATEPTKKLLRKLKGLDSVLFSGYQNLDNIIIITWIPILPR